MSDETKALNHAYIPSIQTGIPLYHKNSDVEVEIPNKSYKVKHKGEEYVVAKQPESYKQEMRNNAAIISNISDTKNLTAKEQIEDLISKYNKKIESYSEKGNEIDFDEMTRDVHILIMLNLRKDGALAKDLQDVAEINVQVLQSKSRELSNSNVKYYLGGGCGIVMIVASGIGVGAACGKIATATMNSKQIMQAANMVIQGANGAKAVENVHDTRNEGEKNWVATSMRVDQEKEGQHRDDGKQALNNTQGVAQKITQHRQNQYQTMLAFVRSY